MRFEVQKIPPSVDGNVADPSAAERRRASTAERPRSLGGYKEGNCGDFFSRSEDDKGDGSLLPPYEFSPDVVISEESEDTLVRGEDSFLLERSHSPSANASNTATMQIDGSVAPIAHIGRLYAKRQTWRLVYKDGTCNVSSKNVTQRKKRYLVDLFTTFVDMRWRYNLIMFGSAFIGSWFLFSLVWWAVAIAHGDHLATNDSNWESCVGGVYDFPTALLFSIETQHTIGYGSRAIESRCPHAVLLLMLQSCVGVFIQSLMTGLLFAKLSRPKGRAQTLMFSRQAVICQRDGEYCLLFRLGDMRKSHIISTSIRALIVKNRLTREGESIPLCQYTLNLETETNFSDGFVFLVWPVTVVHRIDKTSPLWNMSAENLLSEHFEIVVILEGILESTGMTSQFRTSYLPTEILWGQRLAPLLTYQRTNGQYEIDFKQFHNVIPVDSMPECSAQQFQELHRSDDPSMLKEKQFPVNFTTQTVMPRHWSTLKRKLRKARPQSASFGASDGRHLTPGDKNRTRALSEIDNGGKDMQAFQKKQRMSLAAEKSKSAESIGKSLSTSRSRSASDLAKLSILLDPSAGELNNSVAAPPVLARNGKRSGVNLYRKVETVNSHA